MSDYENPYNSPEAPIVPEKSQNVGNLNETMLRYLNETSPWLRFIGIIGFIGCGILTITGIIFAIFPRMISTTFMNVSGSGPFWVISILYFALGILLFFPSRFTYDFGAKIRKYQFSNSDIDLELAFKNNKSLWKFYGILCIVYLALIPFMIVIAIIIGVVAATGFF